MKRATGIAALALILLVALAAGAAAQALSSGLAQIDQMYEQEKHAESVAVVEAQLKAATTDAERAEVLWRQARMYESLGNEAIDAKLDGGKVQDLYAKGEGCADKAIALNAKCYQAYYWKAANAGRWAESRGILDSLFKAGPMRDAAVSAIGINQSFADAYFLLGQLYHKAPGWPLSFGDVPAGANFARLAVELNQKEVAAGKAKTNSDFLIELANVLWDRNWDPKTRASEKERRYKLYLAATTPFERGAQYDGYSAIDVKIGDRTEAEALIRKAVANYLAEPVLLKSHASQLAKARKLMAGWGLK